MSKEEKKTETVAKEQAPKKEQPKPKAKVKAQPKPKARTSKGLVADAIKQQNASLQSIDKAIAMYRAEGQGISRLVNAKRHMTEVRKCLEPYLK